MEQTHVVKHQMVRNVEHERIVMYEQAAVVIVHYDSSQIQHNVNV